ncbi:agmatine deiminase family protein [Gracilimonas mengyeensis]|uniref:Agmatine deiminase n=1 Tax=Gracilimonas mengyeensis TaxID=1302730 RepID=A0A521FLF8_9BACT|nr:agmatine deiminase family protein [Gracilimonas mengyeensis]SMO97063.1 agmatine deiminase [Gracilimonas mengyeensis]
MILEPSYQMPAEWHQHAATQLHWPSNQITWPEEQPHKVEEVYCQIIEELHFYEPIHLFVENLKVRNRVMQKLSLRAVDLDRVIIHQKKINDVRARDYGPLFVKKGNNYVITDWGFNGWGNEYSDRKDEDGVPKYIAEKFGIERLKPEMKLAGGSIDINGNGALITTESLLLNQNQSPYLSKEDIEHKLREYLGAKQIIWLKRGLADDYTDDRVDNITRWLNEDTVLSMVCEDKEDINYSILQENLEMLESVRLDGGKKLNIETLPLLKVKLNDSIQLPASYANFYIANGVVLVPQYDNQYDRQAVELFKNYFSGRKIIGISSKDLLWGKCSLHSITQQWHGALSF